MSKHVDCEANTILEGVMEETDKGSLTIRAGERRVTVFVEEGEVLSIGLHGAAKSGDAMASKVCAPRCRATSNQKMPRSGWRDDAAAQRRNPCRR